MRNRYFGVISLVALVGMAAPAVVNGVERDDDDGGSGFSAERLVFRDTSQAVCDVGNALGPAVPDCAAAEPALFDLCGDLLSAFDIIDFGPVSGDVNGDISVCIRLEGPPDANLFIPVSGAVQIDETDGTVWRGPFTATFALTYGAFGDYFLQDGHGASIRATFTQVNALTDPPLFVNEGFLFRQASDDD